MAYTLLEMMDGRWLEGHIVKRREYSNTFIKDLAFLLNELHFNYLKPAAASFVAPSEMFKIVHNLVPVGDKQIKKFIEQTISEFREIKSELIGKVLLHGDLYGSNIIVDPDGNLQGLIDWEDMCIGDPHWEFRKIRVIIGWQGIEELLSFYNGKCNLEYIKILDKVALCHSLQLRQNQMSRPDSLKPDWKLVHPVHGTPDTASDYEDYIRNWPENIY
jgi:thiamine kinase-like enzyme